MKEFAKQNLNNGDNLKEWKKFKIKDVAIVNPESLSSKAKVDYINYLDTGNITRGKINNLEKYLIASGKAPSRARRIVRKNDIVYSTVRPNQQHYGIIDDPVENMIVSTGFAVLRAKEDLCDSHFLYYFLTLPETIEYLSNVAEDSTTAYPSINPDVIMDMDISLPPIAEQKQIAKMLSSLDDKIDLLHRQNKTLESMAEAIFREWFVENENKSWKRYILGDLCDITRGASPRPIIEFVNNGVIPWIKISDATDGGLFINKTNEFITKEGAERSVKVSPGDLIMSNSATCGLTYFVGVEGCIHDGWLLFRNLKSISKNYLYYFLKYTSREINSMADGSVQDNLNTQMLKEVKLLFPDQNLLRDFDTIVNAMMNKIRLNTMLVEKTILLKEILLNGFFEQKIKV